MGRGYQIRNDDHRLQRPFTLTTYFSADADATAGAIYQRTGGIINYLLLGAIGIFSSYSFFPVGVIGFYLLVLYVLKQHEVDKLHALQRLHDLQQQHTILIEKKVEERTEQLAETNRQLLEQREQLARSNQQLLEQQTLLLQKNKHIETLLDELSHRAKNNLQMLYSLNTLQLPMVKDQAGKQILNEMRARIKSMILVNEYLVGFNKDKTVSLAALVKDIVNHIQQIYDRDKRVTITSSIQPDIQCDASMALPFGLIITELFTNVYKHAFPPGFQRQPTVRLSLSEWQGAISFRFEDNGIGATSPKQAQSMGLSLIRGLIRQLKGTVMVRREHGFRYHFIFLTPINHAYFNY
ncbi:sensor histidine kinase [Parapedobacter koreensis]|uniref:sensor histidine kinase n=1 Tax=Parapedobacter koreensis TaxID=332977 RepID=UPI000B88D128|nr:sensor histidine kinase [Parapedobacter koreensis]